MQFMEIVVTEFRRDGVLVVDLAGHVHGHNADELEERLLGHADAGEREIVLNCERLGYISSAGVRVLVVVGKKLKEIGGTMRMSAVNRNVSDILEIAGLSDSFPVYETEEEAVAAAVSGPA